MNDLSETVDQLSNRLEALEHRVSALEHPGLVTLPATLPLPKLSERPLAAASVQPGRLFSVLGRCMLSIAGAYLLRALAESTMLPRAPVVALALVYAVVWLVPASRAKGSTSAVAWAGTSALILLPMLWELTVRFSFLPVGVAAGVLSSFVVIAAVLAWNHRFAEVLWVVESATAAGAVALGLATQHFAPVLGALLVLVLAGEVAAARGRTLRVRPLVAAAADFAMFGLLWIYAGPAESGGDHPIVEPRLILTLAVTLLLIYAGSATTQTLVLRHRISFFETAQTLAVFLFAAWGAVAFMPESGARWLGALCLAGSACGYALTLGRFGTASSQRNFHVYATGSLALLLVGFFLAIAGLWLPLSLSLLAVSATLYGTRYRLRTLQFHSSACLVAAAVSSGLLVWVGHTLVARRLMAPGILILFVSAAALACYGALASRREEAKWPQALRFVEGALATGIIAALGVLALARMTAIVASPRPQHLAALRTLIGCGLAVSLAWCGSHWRLLELAWLAWIAMLLLAVKLLFEDLRHGHLGYTAASIFVYAVTLMLVPRLLRANSPASPQPTR